jgi:signal transduction histidine kinase/ligand-binding sensor domain-containing protein
VSIGFSAEKANFESWCSRWHGLSLSGSSTAARRLFFRAFFFRTFLFRTLLLGISFALFALFALSAAALDPNRQISQYAHRAWRIQDGFFSGTPQAITQTRDGYLWIGTEDGLVRFDGVRFVPWIAPDGKQLPSASIHSLLGASDGSLWIGTSRGLANWNHLDLVNISGSPAFIEAILQDPGGTVWITRSQVRDDAGPVCEVTGGALHCHGAGDGISFTYGQPLFRDALGNLWVGSSLGLCRWKPDESKTYIDKALTQAKGLAGVGAIAAGDDGSVLVGMKRSGKGLGLQQLSEGNWKDYVLPGMDGTQLEISAMLRDRDGGLWIGTGNQGIYRVHDGKVDHFGGADGLSSDAVQGFYEDREGDIWVASSRGIDRFHETRVVSFSIREGLTSEDVDSVFAARDGTVWIGNTRALDVLRQGKFSAIGPKNGLPGRLITSLLEDHEGRLWVGIDSGLSVYEHGQFRPVSKPDGKPIGVVTAVTEDLDHNIWAATTQPALFRIQDLKVGEEIAPPRIPRVLSLAADPTGGIWLGLATGDLAQYRRGKLEILPTSRPVKHAITNLLAEPDGSIWGATQDGLFRRTEGGEEILNSHNGLPCDTAFALVRDNRGSLWIDTQCGLVVIEAWELNRWLQQPDVKLKVRTLDVFDGAQPGLTNFRPEVSKAPDGRLWVANENILQMVDPEHLQGNSVLPPVQVEQVIADGKKYLPRDGLQLPARTRDVEIDYTALSLVVPEKVRFRYQLVGHDSDWQDPLNRRQAFYTDLPPGNYRFHVVASNNDGVWNEAGAEVGIEVLPAFYQTAWFRICCILAAAGTLALFYVLRLRRLSVQMQARFEERLEERERIARDLHDTLLQGIYSASLHFDLANNRLQEDASAKPALRRGLDLLKQVSQEGRNALRSLRSQEHTSDGLEHALSRLPKEFALPAGVDFQVAAEGRPRVLRPLIRDEAYLIAREAVINAFHHAHPSKIEVEVDYGSRNLRVLVRDNGCGMESGLLKVGREGHWGLTGMRERAEKIGAKLEVLSRPNAGTEIRLLVPGSVAFQDGSTGRSWNWLTRMYPEKRGKKLEESSEEQHK